jgi:hypothetical protein
MDLIVLVIFAAVSLPAFFIGQYMRSRQAAGIVAGRHAGDIDADLAGFIGRTMHGIGTLIVTTGIALTVAPQAYQMPIGIAFVVACNLLVVLIVFRARQSRRQRRER